MFRTAFILAATCLLLPLPAAVAQTEELTQALEAYEAKAFDRALASLTRFITRNPEEPEAYCLRAMVYFAAGDNSRSVADYTQAIRLSPKNASYYFQRATVFADGGDHRKAIADYTTA